MKFKDGNFDIEVMSVAEVEKVRSMSRQKDSLMWVDAWGEGAKKTVIHRLSKRLDLTSEADQAIDRIEQDYDFDQVTGPTHDKPALPRPTDTDDDGVYDDVDDRPIVEPDPSAEDPTDAANKKPETIPGPHSNEAKEPDTAIPSELDRRKELWKLSLDGLLYKWDGPGTPDQASLFQRLSGDLVKGPQFDNERAMAIWNANAAWIENMPVGARDTLGELYELIVNPPSEQ